MASKVPRTGSTIQGDPGIIKYVPMKRDGASTLVEFSAFQTFLKAHEALKEAFPDREFLTGYSDAQMNQIVLNYDSEVTYFKLIENDLLVR